jgi:thiosulfate/3-mercaptopyruvate sulfurtransferase
MNGDAMDWSALVSAEQVAARLDEPGLRLVDARFVLGGTGPGAGEAAWRDAHLPRASYVDLDRDLSDHRKPPSQGRHPLPEADDFIARLARLGIGPEHQVVVYDSSDGAMAASRFWWLLRLLGHRRVAVLDGGFARWTQLGLPVTAQVAPAVPGAGRFEARFDAAAIAGVEEVAARLEDAPGWLLDARAPERFRGEVEPLDRVAGHVPGARNRPYVANLRDGRFRPAAELRAEFAALIGAHAPSAVLLNCGSGVTACQNLLAMEHAGLHGARIYAGSWSGWISDPARPVATGNAL